MAKTQEEKDAEKKAKEEAKAAKDAEKAAAQAAKDAEKAAKQAEKDAAKAAADTVIVDEPGSEKQKATVAKSFPSDVPVKKGKHGATIFQLVVVGDSARVYGKNGLPVSPVTTLREASKLASAFNTRDPEQIEAKARPQGPKKNILAERAAAELEE